MLRHWKDLRHLPRGMWILFATVLVNRAGSMVLAFLVLYLTRAEGCPPARPLSSSSSTASGRSSPDRFRECSRTESGRSE